MTSPTAYDTDENLGLGWKGFAGIMLILAGSINIIQGLVAITNAAFYRNLAAGTNVTLPATNTISTWGWVIFIWGCIVVLAGFYAFTGHMWARITGIAAASINLVLQFSFMAAFPFWAFMIMLIDIFVIWGLAVHGQRVEDI